MPALLTELALRAGTESITASSALHGIVVADAARAAKIIDDKAAVLRSTSEQELAGYRSALDCVFTGEWRPLNVGLLLHLHRELFEYTEPAGGQLKSDDNVVVDRSPDGSVEVRFHGLAHDAAELTSMGSPFALSSANGSDGSRHPDFSPEMRPSQSRHRLFNTVPNRPRPSGEA